MQPDTSKRVLFIFRQWTVYTRYVCLHTHFSSLSLQISWRSNMRKCALWHVRPPMTLINLIGSDPYLFVSGSVPCKTWFRIQCIWKNDATL